VKTKIQEVCRDGHLPVMIAKYSARTRKNLDDGLADLPRLEAFGEVKVDFQMVEAVRNLKPDVMLLDTSCAWTERAGGVAFDSTGQTR
jgi:chemotaxis response regulator CheB